MTSPAPRWTLLLLAVVCLMSAGNAVLYWRLSSQMTDLKSALANSPQPAKAAAVFDHLAPTDLPTTATTASGRSIATQGGNIPVWMDPVQQLKQRKSQDPARATAEMERLMAQEPSLPSVEQAQQRAIQQALQNIPADMSQPAGLQTQCRGRRCLVSAGFSGDLEAHEWAQKLLLAGGKEFPRAARIITSPIDNSGAVRLQIYLF